MKGPFASFSLHLELQNYILLSKASFLFSHCNADFGCSIDWMVLAVQLTGCFWVSQCSGLFAMYQ